ncbi:MAG: Rrf2 family transcriptional regulator [Candidatus Hydrogenedentes bacterium]|nr:Rrf2 family transcriptional regulator [Candidatus Hydrogenedentota bacterium]
MRVRARSVCKQAGIPEAYSRKVFQSLVQGGFLRAVLGPGGGYELMRDPAEITLLEVIRAVDGEDTFGECILGFALCGGDKPCPFHELWGNARSELLERLGAQTMATLAAAQASRQLGDVRVDLPKRRGRPKKTPAG